MTTSTTDSLLFERQSAVATLRFNRPDALNAIDLPMATAFLAAVRQIAADPGIRAVVLRGAGKGFMAGGDMATMHADPVQGSASLLGPINEALALLHSINAPVIAQVHGYCLAGGSELATACDLVYVADDAQIGYPPVRLMSPPDMQFHPWTMGMRQAMESMLTGDSLSGREAAARGWANRAYPADELEAQVLALAARVAQLPSELAAINKRSVHRAMEIMGLRAAIRAGTELQALAFQTPASQAYMGRFRRSGESVSALLSERDAAFGDYRESGD